ncbi:MAG: hypothetical protein GYA34_12715 [Chloroflexi bacterium]|nr:hypothetical protein [Chloroflexota bacterium]
MVNSTFQAFLNEAQFTKEILSIGVTQLYKANYNTKGIYYQAFTCLSIGIERAAKLCSILDFYIINHGTLPQEDYIRQYGHEILGLFKHCHEIANQRQITFNFPNKFDNEIHWSILQVLNDFAQSSGRYSDINTLLGKNQILNCMHQWHETVDKKIFEKHVSTKKKQRIENQAKELKSDLQQIFMVHFIGEDSMEITDLKEAMIRTDIWKAVAPYRQLYTLRIIRFFAEIIDELGFRARGIGLQEIPYFSDIFGIFYNNDTYFKSRKTWDKL